MGAVIHLAQMRQAQEARAMARGRLRAIDEMIEKLTMESAGRTFEELSDLL